MRKKEESDYLSSEVFLNPVILSGIVSHLETVSELLAFRLVCRTWESVINSCLNSKDKALLHVEGKSHQLSSLGELAIKSTISIVKILSIPASFYRANCIPMETFLQTAGHLIKHLEITQGESEKSCCTRFQEQRRIPITRIVFDILFKFCVNLEELSVDDDNVHRIYYREETKIQDIINPHVLPNLTLNLRRLELCTRTKYPPKLTLFQEFAINTICQYADKLTQLCFSGNSHMGTEYAINKLKCKRGLQFVVLHGNINAIPQLSSLICKK